MFKTSAARQQSKERSENQKKVNNERAGISSNTSNMGRETFPNGKMTGSPGKDF